MANTNNVRRTITNLRDPQQIRELNRQLEWIWNQLLGGLNERAFSAVGRARITEVVQNKIAENINADSATVVRLKAALADLMVATIAVAEIDWAHIVDLNADRLDALNAVIKSLDAQHADVTTLAAALAEIAVLEARSATFNKATVNHLVSQALNLDGYGTMDDVFIRNLKVAYAQMVSATIGNLCLRASDGNYYTIDVSQAGLVTATLVSPSSAEIDAGQTTGGRTIVETEITAGEMNTATLLATYALVNKIDAATIDVDQLFAREAFIDKLIANIIEGEDFIEIRTKTDGLNDVVQIETDGLHVIGVNENYGVRRYTGNEVLIDDTGMSVLINGIRYSRFASSFAQFGNYQLRHTAEGGLAFVLVEPEPDPEPPVEPVEPEIPEEPEVAG